jgi:ABC-type branched-subunit amino acid transport system ATPase component
MNAPARQHVSAGHRARVLRALGVTPWVRRAVPEHCSTRELDLLGRALNACGAALARAARVTSRGGQIAEKVPEARAYLVFGEAQAHALGRALPAAVMHQAQIVLADEPALVLTSAEAKRRLWNALRSLRRALASGG